MSVWLKDILLHGIVMLHYGCDKRPGSSCLAVAALTIREMGQ